MYPKYFRDKIYSELEASCSYLKKAMDSLKTHPEWGEKFKEMSDDRYKHALSLYAMFMDLYKESKDQDTYINSVRDNIIEGMASKSHILDGYKATYEVMSGTSR